MKHLILFSHPDPKSFNHAILEAYTRQLQANRQDVRVRDIYRLAFDPILKFGEIEGFEQGRVPSDIAEEQEHIRWADRLTVICPIWWGGFPSNLRGYFDRVFSLGFAYAEGPDGVKGLLTDKEIFTINTIGAPQKVYEDEGLFKAMDAILDKIVFSFCGLKGIGHHYFAFVDGARDSERQKMLENVKDLADRMSQQET